MDDSIRFDNSEFKFGDLDTLAFQKFNDWYNTRDNIVTLGEGIGKLKDNVNSPAHYTKGRVEAIDVIEDAIQEAPSVKVGMLQAQVLKYLLRLWHKSDSKEDAEKARWYLDRLIDSL